MNTIRRTMVVLVGTLVLVSGCRSQSESARRYERLNSQARVDFEADLRSAQALPEPKRQTRTAEIVRQYTDRLDELFDAELRETNARFGVEDRDPR